MQYILIKKPRVYPNNQGYQIAKRILDISICILSTPVFFPLMLLCAIAIRLDSTGPILFIQERVGKGGRRFRMYKFRSMYVSQDNEKCRSYMKSYIRGELTNCDQEQNIYKPASKEQITRVGRLLRKISVDELPQLINVIKGEMSIVGPRPNVPWEVEEYRPWHHERFEVLPGITGLAQINGRSCINFISLVRYDIEYIEKQSLVLDLKILWWSATTILKGKGAN